MGVVELRDLCEENGVVRRPLIWLRFADAAPVLVMQYRGYGIQNRWDLLGIATCRCLPACPPACLRAPTAAVRAACACACIGSRCLGHCVHGAPIAATDRGCRLWLAVDKWLQESGESKRLGVVSPWSQVPSECQRCRQPPPRLDN
jgi:hypothetical protein